MQTTTLALALLLTCLFLMVSVSPCSPQNPERIALEGSFHLQNFIHSVIQQVSIVCHSGPDPELALSLKPTKLTLPEGRGSSWPEITQPGPRVPTSHSGCQGFSHADLCMPGSLRVSPWFQPGRGLEAFLWSTDNSQSSTRRGQMQLSIQKALRTGLPFSWHRLKKPLAGPLGSEGRQVDGTWEKQVCSTLLFNYLSKNFCAVLQPSAEP